MKRLLLVLVLGSCLAWSQEEDNILRQYGLAFSSLENSVTALSEGDSVTAREELDGLENTLRVLQSETTSLNVVDALQNTIGLAQTSIQNQSETDLSVQVAVLNGGFWRLVYESAINAADQGDVATAKARLLQIANDMNLPESTLSAIEATSADAEQAALTMLTLLEQGVANDANAKLAAADELAATDRDASYIQLAEAYSLFIPVQDSPRATGGETQVFEETFALVTEPEIDVASFSAQIAQLNQQMSQFAEAASAGLDAPIEGAVTPTVDEADDAIDTATSDAVADIDEIETLETDVAAALPTDAELADTATTDAEADEGATDAAATPAAADATTALSLPPAAPEATEELEREFAGFNLAPRRRGSLAQSYVDAGYESVEEALNALYAESAKLVVAVETGNQARAKTLVTNLDTLYTDFAAPLVANNSSFDASMQDLLGTLQASPVLRLQDAAVLSGHVEALDMTLQGNTVPRLHNAIVSTTNIWAGWLRTVMVVLLAFLALVPLYLLRLAFGGGNRNWQLIGGALLCLLLPLMFEGLSHLAVLISQAAGGVGALDTFASLSIFQNEISQVIWVLLSALAIGLATAGLYGICVQFGLLGRRTASTQATSLETSVGNTAINTSFDWDEEF